MGVRPYSKASALCLDNGSSFDNNFLNGNRETATSTHKTGLCSTLCQFRPIAMLLLWIFSSFFFTLPPWSSAPSSVYLLPLSSFGSVNNDDDGRAKITPKFHSSIFSISRIDFFRKSVENRTHVRGKFRFFFHEIQTAGRWSIIDANRFKCDTSNDVSTGSLMR